MRSRAPQIVTNPDHALEWMVDFTLITILDQSRRKSRSVAEFNRQLSIAQTGIDNMRRLEIKPTLEYTKMIIENDITVEEWIRAEPEFVEHTNPKRSRKQ